MSEGNTGQGIGERLRNARQRQGFTQRELAELSGVTVSLIRKLEQGERDSARTETVRRLASPLDVRTSDLLGAGRREESSVPGAIWVPARDAVLLPAHAGDLEAVTGGGLSAALADAVGLYQANRYTELARVLPGLLADAGDASPLVRSRVNQLAGSVMVQTRNREAARVALDRSLADAEAAGDEFDAASAVITLCWLLLTEGRFTDVLRLSSQWADRVEPRISRATGRELSAWGWLLLRGSAAAVRDNRPGEADDMMRLATAAAAAVGREQGGYHSYWTTFGPATVAMKRVENAVVDGRPDVALRLARDVPPGLRPTSDNRNRHLLDVASAHLELRRSDEALGVLSQLSEQAGPWLAEQRMARDLFGQIVRRGKRRAWTAQMRDVAAAVGYVA